MLENLDEFIPSIVTGGRASIQRSRTRVAFDIPLLPPYQNKSLRTTALKVGRGVRVDMSEQCRINFDT